jgi:hypothetical protein
LFVQRVHPIGVAGENPRHDVRVSRGLDHVIEGRNKLGRVELTRNSQRRGEIPRAHKQHVDAGRGRNAFHVLQRAQRLDLYDAEQRVVHRRRVSQVAPELTRPVVTRHASISSRRVPEMRHGLTHLFWRLQSGKHHAVGAQVQRVSHSNALGRLNAHQY